MLYFLGLKKLLSECVAAAIVICPLQLVQINYFRLYITRLDLPFLICSKPFNWWPPGGSQHGSLLLQTQSFGAMERNGNASINGVPLKRIAIDLNELPPASEETIDVSDQSEDDVPLPPPPPPPFSIQLCFHNEDMEVLKQKYKVLGSSKVTKNVYFRKLGFEGDCDTLMHIRDKRVKFPGKSLNALGRSWLKTDFTEKDKPQDLDMMVSFPEPLSAQMVEERMERDKYKEKSQVSDLMVSFAEPLTPIAEERMEVDKNKEKGTEYDAETIAATELFREFINKANDQACRALEKGKQKVEEPVRYTSGPHCGKKKWKSVPNMLSLNAKLSIN